MKKLNIFLILLLGLLAFAPQIALADSISPIPYEERQKINEQKEKDLRCLYERKSKIPKKYNGSNIQLETIPHLGYPYISYNKEKSEISTKHTDSGRKLLTQSRSFSQFHYRADYPETKILYFCGLKNCFNRVVESIVNNCKEYVVLEVGTPGFDRKDYVFDITEVPQGSYLKYLPQTNELKILPPLEDLQQTLPPLESEYKEIIKNQLEKWKAEGELKRQQKIKKQIVKEKIKEKISVIAILLGIVLVSLSVVVLIRKIRKAL